MASQESPNITIKAGKNLILGCTTFENLAYPENWPLLYEALRMLAAKKNECSQGTLKEHAASLSFYRFFDGLV